MIEAIAAEAARPRRMDDAPSVPFGYVVASLRPREASYGVLAAKRATSVLCRASHRLSEAMRQRQALVFLVALDLPSIETP